ncbi:MAG: hypothetical protein ACTHM5_06545 [Ginsengibacter sp.]
MKTTLLFSAALFLATASFAQTQANSQATIKGKSEIKSDNVKAKADASSEAGLQANTIKEDHRAAASAKSSTSATANQKGKLVSGIASDKSDASVQGKEKGKLISSIASDEKSESGSTHSAIDGSANANTSSNGHLKTHMKKIKHSGKKDRKAVTAAESSTSVTANEKGKLISGIASDKSDASVQGKEKGKLISGIASDGKSESASAHSEVKGNANANANSNIKPHVKKIKRSGKKIKASSANTIQAGAAAVHAVKVPVSVKTHAGVGVHIQ